MAIDIQKSVAGVKEKLAAFSTAQMVIIGLLGAVGIIAAGAFLRWVTAPSYEVLLAGLDPADAAAVTEQLEGSGVDYQLAAGGSTVLVPAAQLQEQRIAVAAAGLPEGSSKGYELLDAQGMTASSFQQEVAYQRALEGELARTLREMKDVRNATVHLAVPEEELYTDQQKPVQASVLLDTAGTLPNDTVDAVQRLVASGVPNLEPEAVTVSDTRGRLLSSDNAAGMSSTQLEAEQAIEDAAAARADTMLASVLGPNRAVVRVNAELDTAERSTESETFDDEGAAVLRESDVKETYEANGTLDGGIINMPEPEEGAGEQTSTYAKEEGTTEYGVSREVQKETQAPGALKRLSVAVMVDENAVGLPTDAVLTELVSNAVGVDAARGDTISLAAVPFQTDDTVAVDEATRDWTGPLGTGVAATVLLAIAAVFLRAVRRGKVDELPVAALDEPEEEAPATPEAQAIETDQALALESVAEKDPFDETKVLELVEKRPDEVTALIRGWLSEPAESGKKK